MLELLAHWERVTGTRVPHRMAGRRYGDVPTLVCDGSRGQRELSWTPQYDIDDMCEYLLLYCRAGVSACRSWLLSGSHRVFGLSLFSHSPVFSPPTSTYSY